MMKAVQMVSKGKLELVHIPIPNASKNQIRIKVKACGICHTDKIISEGILGDIFPRVPGHEVVGIIDQLGEDENKGGFKIGDHVSVGWYGGDNCNNCSECRTNDFVLCSKAKVCGLSYNGGYAEYMVGPYSAFAKVPEGLEAKDAACLNCAGVTTFNSIRKQNILAGSLVGVVGIGGLGHLAIQYLNKMGYEVVVFSTTQDKEKLARELGAHHFINTKTATWKDDTLKLGSLKLVVVTAPSTQAASEIQYVVGKGGKLLLLAPLPDEFPVNTHMLLANRSICGFSSGDARDSEDTMRFSQIHNVKAMIQTVTLEESIVALQNIGDARFRYIITFP